jgi:hypothetical protein
MSDNWRYVTPPSQSFARVPVCTHLGELDAEIAIIGLHYVSPYPLTLSAASAKSAEETAPDAIRRQSSIFVDHLDHYSFDFNNVLYLITIDTDALDTAIAPGVLFTSPGGLTFDETTDLVRGIARRGTIVGINLFEVRPELDINYLTASTGAQLIINFIGTLAHSGQIGS